MPSVLPAEGPLGPWWVTTAVLGWNTTFHSQHQILLDFGDSFHNIMVLNNLDNTFAVPMALRPLDTQMTMVE